VFSQKFYSNVVSNVGRYRSGSFVSVTGYRQSHPDSNAVSTSCRLPRRIAEN